MNNAFGGGLAVFTLVAGLAGAAIADGHGKGHGAHPAKDGHAMKMEARMIVESAWARASPGNASVGGAYVTVANRGKMADRLIAIETAVARRAEIHTHIEDKGIMRMRRVDAVDVAPGETLEMKPGGSHIMLMGLHKPLKQGEKFSVTLVFEKAGKVTAEIGVRAVGAMGGSGHRKH